MTHIPVLLHEVVNVLDPKTGECFVDGTLGGGGYAAEILNRFGGSGKFLGIDWDSRMLRDAQERISGIAGPGVELALEVGNYADLLDILGEKGFGRADGIVLDLGFSSDHVGVSGRGFSFMRDEPLLMTYSDDATPVKELIRGMDESELRGIIRAFGEERYAGRIARAIKERLRRGKIEMSGELTEIIVKALPRQYERGRIHPATRTFQALRIFANRELENLEQFIETLPEIVAPGGRVAIVSFHSLEDRIVKHGFRGIVSEGLATLITKKPITPTLSEIAENPRARSAKLRAISFLPKTN
ncbi:MAG: 16S rRNA (cytosine(1402)-N(4))-methyltransferase RsmH [Patescibacteria group bacterium]